MIIGEALCRGYCEALRNLLAELGIESLIICGGGKKLVDNMPSHAWNQVYLDGKWYNCDITNDADFINAGLKLPFFLKSNDDFGEGEFHRYSKYPLKEPEIVQVADTTISDKQQEAFVEEQRKNILEQTLIEQKERREKIMKEEKQTKTNSKTFLKVLKDFFQRGKEDKNKGESRDE